jgi:hypothetical protein
VALSDLLPFFQRVFVFFRSRNSFSLKNFWETVVQGREQLSVHTGEYAKLVASEPEEYDDVELPSPKKLTTINAEDLQQEQSRPSFQHIQISNWSSERPPLHVHAASAASDRTSFDIHSPRNSEHSDDTLVREASHMPQLSRKIGSVVFQIAERSLVLAGFGQLLTGVVVYTGGCRENYLNGCLAHLISASSYSRHFLVSSSFILQQRVEYSGVMGSQRLHVS